MALAYFWSVLYWAVTLQDGTRRQFLMSHVLPCAHQMSGEMQKYAAGLYFSSHEEHECDCQS